MEYTGFLLSLFLNFCSNALIDCLPIGQAIIWLEGKKKRIFKLCLFILNILVFYIIKTLVVSYTIFMIGIVAYYILISITIIDFKYLVIPDTLNLSLGILAAFSIILKNVDKSVWNHLLSIPFNFFLIVFILILEKKTKKEMLGGGDLKLLISAGLFLGLRKEIIVVGMSSIVMLLEIMLIKIFLKKKYDGLYPFGPSISFSIMLVYLLGNSQYHLF